MDELEATVPTDDRIHRTLAGHRRRVTTDNAERLGMRTVLQDKAHTSQGCPRCLHRHKPCGREHRCSPCGFRFHRDGVDAINIRHKRRATRKNP